MFRKFRRINNKIFIKSVSVFSLEHYSGRTRYRNLVFLYPPPPCIVYTGCLGVHKVLLKGSQDTLFSDPELGGYFATRDQDPQIVLRLKDDHVR